MNGELRLENGQPNCTVSDVINLNQDGQTDVILPICDESLSIIPCYRFEVDRSIVRVAITSCQFERGKTGQELPGSDYNVRL